MNHLPSTLLRVMSRLVLAAATVLAASPARANDGAAREGGTWWQWALSIPASVNPLVDATGQNCMVGQEGSTWYLAGNFFGGAASRSCSVPQGVRLFFPIANYVSFDTPGICGQGASKSVAELRADSAAFVDGLTVVSATLNSRPVRGIKRIRSHVFPVVLPADNLFVAPCSPLPVPAGVYPRGVDDGWYAEIEHLAPGVHTLQINAAGAGGFAISTVYTLTIVPRN